MARTQTRARHVRKRSFSRLRHDRMGIRVFLAAEAVDLNGTGAAQTFTATAATNRLTVTGHGFTSGDGPFNLSNSGGALPGGLDASSLYYVRVIDANTVELVLDKEDAVLGSSLVNFLTDGTGTNSIALADSAEAIFAWMKRGRTPRQIAAATDIDSL